MSPVPAGGPSDPVSPFGTDVAEFADFAGAGPPPSSHGLATVLLAFVQDDRLGERRHAAAPRT